MEQIDDFPVPQVAAEIHEVEMDDGPVQQVAKDILEVVEITPRERISEHIHEQFVDAPVQQTLEEVVDVFDEPSPQLQEETLDVIQPIPTEHMSVDEGPELTECATRIMQLVQRKTRAKRHGKHNLMDSSGRSGRCDTVTSAGVHDVWIKSAADRGGPTLPVH